MILYRISRFLENPYREDLLVKITFVVGILVNILTWASLYFKLHPFSYQTEYGQIFLHYNIYFGVDNFGYWYYSFIIPALGLFIIFFNNILAYFFYLKDKLVTYLLVISQAVLQVVLFIAAIFVILLNI